MHKQQMRVSISDYIGNLTCHFVTCISHEILYCSLQYVCIFNYIFRLIYMRILAFCLNDIKEKDLMLTPNHTHTHREAHLYTETLYISENGSFSLPHSQKSFDSPINLQALLADLKCFRKTERYRKCRLISAACQKYQ